VDADGIAEWVGAYVWPAGPGGLGAFVFDDGTWHDLAPLADAKYGLGQHRACEIAVRDVNVDGRMEILVWGYAGESTDLLHMFAWDGASYPLLAFFEGTAGIRMEEAHGNLAEDVVVGHRADNDLVWEVIYTWDGATYGWTWDRHTWFYADRPHVYDTSSPERVVISFYLAIDDGDVPGAYSLLSEGARSARPYDQWAVGFATTVGVEASAVRETSTGGNGTANVSAQVLARDNVDGRIIATLWEVAWTAVRENGHWRLDAVSVAELEQWELPYYR
jgi:hypothetical protein